MNMIEHRKRRPEVVFPERLFRQWVRAWPEAAKYLRRVHEHDFGATGRCACGEHRP